MLVRVWSKFAGRAIVALAFCLFGAAFGATLRVTNDYPTIQAALNAASSGDTINIGAGRYNEQLTITLSVILIGSGTNNCVVDYTNSTPVVSIIGPGTVQLSNFQIIGGQYNSCCGGWYSGTTAQGIVATNVTLGMNNMLLNNIRNYFVTVNNGYLYATNVTLFTPGIILQQCDVGFELSGCTGSVYNLIQDAGQIDHTIDNYNSPSATSLLTIDHCRIRASDLTWGNCVRTYSASQIIITNCFFYRKFETPATNYPGLSHDGIGINGYSNYVMITGNTFSNLPWALGYYGSPGFGGNQVIVEHNTIINPSSGGITVQGQQYEGLDLGGGRWGSRGLNIFSQSRTDVTGYVDVYMVTNPGAAFSSSNVSAISNCWSAANPDDRILDQLDVPSLGRVFSSPTLCPNLASFTASATNGVAPFMAIFTDSSSGGITNRFWDFGDATTANSIGTVVTNTYQAGTYGVTLIVSGPLNSSTNIQANLIVVAHAPPVVVQDPSATDVCAGSTANFAIAASGGGTLAYQWQTNSVNLSNGSAYSGVTSNVLTITPVTAVVVANYRCLVSNDGGSTTSAVATLALSPTVVPAVTVAVVPGTTICAGTTVTFTATPVNGGSGPTYVWKKNGGVVGDSSGSYTDGGLADGDTIDCQLISNAGCAAPAITNATPITITVTAGQLSVSPAVWDFGPVATGVTVQTSFTVTNLGCGLLTGTAGCAGPFAVKTGSPYSLAGLSATNVVVSFTPPAEGWFTNTVVFSSDGGVVTNQVIGQGMLTPAANFSASPSNGLATLLVLFADASTGTITNRYWDFGDGLTTNTIVTNLTHSYGLAGTNAVQLIVSGPGGSSTNASSIVVTAYPAGDVNGDIRVTSADSLLINQVLVGLRGSNSAAFARTGFPNGDVNQNAAVSGADSLLINQVIVGLRAYVVTRITPGERTNNVPIAVTIYGIGFPTNTVTEVTIGPPVDLTLSNIVVISREQINALMPAGGGSGTGPVSVVATPSNGVTSFGRFINP